MSKKIEISFLHLHSPLFFAKRNWGEKIDSAVHHKGKVEMVYDRELGEVLIKCEKHTSIIPISNVVSMTPVSDSLEEQAAAGPQIVANPLVNPPKGKPGPKTILKPQASSPHDHVFAGPGAGQAGIGGK